MSAELHETGKNSGDLDREFSAETVMRWRQEAAERRTALFRENKWKNRQPFIPIQSRAQEQAFSFVLGWYEESGEELKRGRERVRLDDLIALGLDVNDPRPGKSDASEDTDADGESGDNGA